MNYAIILAGGIGSRFWPLSRHLEPKQFLNIYSSKSMLEEAMHRIGRLVKKENIYIATNMAHYQKIKNCLGKFDISLKNMLFEPKGKNTLAPIGILSRKINDLDHEAVIVVFPCDHFVKDTKRFLELLNKGIEVAKRGYIVTLGISPTRPEIGYGYIKIKSQVTSHKSQVYKVDRFIEKPNISKAKKFIKDKRFYWNSGIFIFRASVMLEEIRTLLPRVYQTIKNIKNKRDLNALWHKLPEISVDYAIMEKTKKIVLLPADYGWIDIGSWQAIEEIIKKDKNGNIFRGNHLDMGSRNVLVWADKRLVVTLGLENVIVVDTEDALLVCSKDKTQDVKKVVQILKRKNFLKQV